MLYNYTIAKIFVLRGISGNEENFGVVFGTEFGAFMP